MRGGSTASVTLLDLAAAASHAVGAHTRRVVRRFVHRHGSLRFAALKATLFGLGPGRRAMEAGCTAGPLQSSSTSTPIRPEFERPGQVLASFPAWALTQPVRHLCHRRGHAPQRHVSADPPDNGVRFTFSFVVRRRRNLPRRRADFGCSSVA